MDINKLALLANIPLTLSEQTVLPNQLENILGYVSKLQTFVSTLPDNSLPSGQLHNITRPDTVTPSSIKATTYTIPAVIDQS